VVYRTVRRLSNVEHKAIVFVSHFLDEVVALTDCVTILRTARRLCGPTRAISTKQRIAEAIVGRQIIAMVRGRTEAVA